MKVVSVEQMQTIEAASDATGHTYDAMMERAGQAVAEALMGRLTVAGKRVLVLIGPGNNGGDGLVAARYLAQAGAEVACYLTRARDAEEDENFRRVQEMEVFCAVADGDGNRRALRQLASGADAVIDALLGTGTHLPLRGTIAEVLETVGAAVRRSRPTPASISRIGGVDEPGPRSASLILAVDGPSGLEFDTGELDPLALPADLSVTFAYPKQGLFRFPGAAAVGDLLVADIGTDPQLAAEIELEVVTSEMVRRWLPARPPDAHKGTFGRALVVGGSSNYTGAVRLAAGAAVRSGAGLVTVALPSPIHGAVAAGLAEATYLLLPHEIGVIASAAREVLAREIEAYDAMILGPGMGRERETVRFMEGLLLGPKRRSVGFVHASDEHQKTALPSLVIDADGLNILATLTDWPSLLPPDTILTPHPGEMARLMDATTGEVQADRVEVARRQAREWGQVVLLKGAYTVVAAPDGRTVLEPFANPGLATGGTGDVLAGIVVALRAQGMDAFEAAAAGAYAHGLAGELARAEMGAAGMAAGDLVEFLPPTWQRLGRTC